MYWFRINVFNNNEDFDVGFVEFVRSRSKDYALSRAVGRGNCSTPHCRCPQVLVFSKMIEKDRNDVNIFHTVIFNTLSSPVWWNTYKIAVTDRPNRTKDKATKTIFIFFMMKRQPSR